MVSPVGVGPGPQPYQPLTAPAQAGADVETGAPSTETLADRLKLADELSAQAAEQAKPQDVGQLTAREAKARHDQLSLMQRAGVFQYMGMNAVLKGEKTNSLDTYMGPPQRLVRRPVARPIKPPPRRRRSCAASPRPWSNALSLSFLREDRPMRPCCAASSTRAATPTYPTLKPWREP